VKRKVLVICGPTAIGKTSTGIFLAKKFNGEIISADSRQVYRGMDIGTGKGIRESSKINLLAQQADSQLSIGKFQIGYYLIKKVPVWLLDLVSPRYQLSVVDWLVCAKKVVGHLWQKNKLPIIVGGTGFYLKVLIDGLDSLGVPPDDVLRQELKKWSLSKLQRRLKQIAPATWNQLNRSDRLNPRRLIRKIEIALKREALDPIKKGRLQADYLLIGLTAPRPVIYRRIDQRVAERLKAGLVEEIKRLLKQGISWQDPGMNTLAYKEFRDFFENKTSLSEAVKRWRFDEHRYARRQLTWFKKEKRIHWFDITQPDWREAMVKLIWRWYSKK